MRLAFWLLGLALLAGPVAAQSPPAAPLPPGPPLRITAVTQPVPTFVQYTRVDVPFLREMAARTGGRIEVTLASHAERNLSGIEIVRLVRSGQAEIGGGTLSTLSGDVPLLDGVDLAGMTTDVGQARRVIDALLPEVNRALERFNTRVVAHYPFPAQVFFCRQPFASLADLRGRRVRTFGNSLVDLVTGLGAQPVSIGFPEVYSALERGVVDCAISGTGGGAAARWPDVTTHISDLPLSWGVSVYMVNLGWWNRLDPAIRAYLQGQFDEMTTALWQLGAEATRDGIDCATGQREACRIHPLANRPMTEVKASAEDAERLREILRARVLPGFVQRCGARCGEVYNELVAPITSVRAGG